MVDLRAVQAGYRFPAQHLQLDSTTVSAYVAAVEDHSPLYQGDTAVVPPLAVLALAMRGLAELLAQNPGALHVTQRLASHRAVPVGTDVVAHLQVESRSERRGFAALTLALRVDAGGTLALEGSMLLMVPLTDRSARHA